MHQIQLINVVQCSMQTLLICVSKRYLSSMSGATVITFCFWCSIPEFSINKANPQNNQWALIFSGKNLVQLMYSFLIKYILDLSHIKMSNDIRKPIFRVSNHVWHILGQTASEVSLRLEILYSGRGEIYVSSPFSTGNGQFT